VDGGSPPLKGGRRGSGRPEGGVPNDDTVGDRRLTRELGVVQQVAAERARPEVEIRIARSRGLAEVVVLDHRVQLLGRLGIAVVVRNALSEVAVRVIPVVGSPFGSRIASANSMSVEFAKHVRDVVAIRILQAVVAVQGVDLRHDLLVGDVLVIRLWSALITLEFPIQFPINARRRAQTRRDSTGRRTL
jgi:hypothetical protein